MGELRKKKVKADREVHKFTYSVYPHKGTVYEADTVRHAYALNQTLVAKEIGAKNGKNSESFSLFACDRDNVIIETVKKAENSGDVVVRMIEAKNKKTKASILLGADFKKAYLCDLLEKEIKEMPIIDHSLPVEISNFEIVTIKLKA